MDPTTWKALCDAMWPALMLLDTWACRKFHRCPDDVVRQFTLRVALDEFEHGQLSLARMKKAVGLLVWQWHKRHKAGSVGRPDSLIYEKINLGLSSHSD